MYMHNNSVNRNTAISPNDCFFSEMPTEFCKDPGGHK